MESARCSEGCVGDHEATKAAHVVDLGKLLRWTGAMFDVDVITDCQFSVMEV